MYIWTGAGGTHAHPVPFLTQRAGGTQVGSVVDATVGAGTPEAGAT